MVPSSQRDRESVCVCVCACVCGNENEWVWVGVFYNSICRVSMISYEEESLQYMRPCSL